MNQSSFSGCEHEDTLVICTEYRPYYIHFIFASNNFSYLLLCRWRQHEAALLRGCLCVRLCIPGHSTAAVSELQGQVLSLPGPCHVVPQHLPQWRVDAVRVRKPLGRSVSFTPSCQNSTALCYKAELWMHNSSQRTHVLPTLSHRGKQRVGSRAPVEERWSAGSLLFSGGSPQSQACHSAQQTINPFLKLSFSVFF